ncbi:MAG: S-methyl-5-thioribose-1-phosphate isomerase [Candidatus Omnitrophica bacterium]|nr:S-methyl-5-thioribose-1-phosphate isomerase [Candidatus Omnitrophota bacterium]
MKYDTIRWKNDKVEMIDQRLLPAKTTYVSCRTDKDIYSAIKTMIIRGAPAIGVAGAYGVYLGVRRSRAKDWKGLKKDVDKTVKYLAGSRPTARNLFWALERMQGIVNDNKGRKVTELKKILLDEAHRVLAEDKKICRVIGDNGASLIPKGANVLTHCNAGALATGGYGTALGVIFSARRKIKRVYADETRPRLQGARLTAWELAAEGIPVTLICDNMAASLMAKKEIDAIIVGADRIASNGDTANKIGTYNLAVAAHYHKIPFYVAAPASTFDLSTSNGKKIPIEERSGLEVKKIGAEYIAPKNISVINPAFDVTPAKLITAIITEKGIIRKPNRKKVLGAIGGD